MPSRTSTAILASCPFFEVLEHGIAEPDGDVERRVQTLRMPDWVAVVALTVDGRFVLVRQHRHGIDRDTLETPGGIIDAGEDPAATALRELVEETGYAGERAEPLGSVHPNPALQDNRCHMFLVRDVREVAPPHQTADERTEPVVVDAAALRRAMEDGTISHALALVALERALARLEPRGQEVLRRAATLLSTMEETQRSKVLELARRLRPGLTAEDIRNPHDFPDLDDPDWHFEDGQLAGIEAVRFALHGLTRDLFPNGEEESPT